LPSRPRRAYRTEPLTCPDRLHHLSRAPSLPRFFEEGYCANYQFVEAFMRWVLAWPGWARGKHLAQWCAKSITTAISQIGTSNNHKRPLPRCRQRRMSSPQIAFSRRKTAQIGKTPIAQTNGSPVTGIIPFSSGILQPREANQT
jgi:hypothetical protein